MTKADKTVLLLAWLNGTVPLREAFKRRRGEWLGDGEFVRFAGLAGMPHELAIALLTERNARQLPALLAKTAARR